MPLYLVSLGLVALLIAVAGVGAATRAPSDARSARSVRSAQRPQATPAQPRVVPGSPLRTPSSSVPSSTPSVSPSAAPPVPRGLPGGVTRIFGPGRMLVAYYGTAGTGSLGVLGEAGPDAIMPRLAQAAREFGVGGRTVQPVFELIVRVARGGPTANGSYSADIGADKVRSYIDAAHRHGVLLVLDLQPGRASFLAVAKRWAWALKDPWVGLALDPEWRVGGQQRPAQVIGSVSAAEVNSVSAWLEDLSVRESLPQKLFVLHQFRSSMIRTPRYVVPREHLAMVQQIGRAHV